ncbi:MAG: ribonuclease III family protein [Promethearchaeota archaeon]
MINDRISQVTIGKILDWLTTLDIEKMDISAVITAFTHPSYKGMYPHVEDYERLEFIGDAVLDLVSAEDLFRQSEANEGILTEQRKLLVSNEHLSRVFDALNIQPLIRTAMNYSPSIKDKANFVEAFFGAVFREYRFERCVKLWHTIQGKIGEDSKLTTKAPISPEDEKIISIMGRIYDDWGLTVKNAKSLLQELCQKQGANLPEYTEMERNGPDHKPIFRVEVSGVIFEKSVSAIGEGSTKKIAQIKAAEKLCDRIFLKYIPSSSGN